MSIEKSGHTPQKKLTSISSSSPLPTAHFAIPSISLLAQIPIDLSFRIYEPAEAMLCPQFSSVTTASSSLLSWMFDNATRPSVEADSKSLDGGGFEDEDDEEGRKDDVEGRRDRWVISSE